MNVIIIENMKSYLDEHTKHKDRHTDDGETINRIMAASRSLSHLIENLNNKGKGKELNI